jgi:hypothetical protein
MTRRIATPLAIALAGLSVVAGPAFAKGGVKDPAPAPAPETAWVDVCEGYWDMPAYDDGSLPIVNRTNGGCVIVKHSLTGVNRLDQVVLVPGWTYVVEANGEGTTSRVQLSFTNPTTGEKASIRVENGKTDIR